MSLALLRWPTPAPGHMGRVSRGLGLLALLSLLAACASGPHANPADPLEPLNRSIYQFNDAVDQAVLQPVAKTYQKITPSPVRQGVSNFFANLEDSWSFVNNVLQFKAQAAAESLLRFAFNSTFGFGGVLDIATELRLQKHKTDFGQTLGHWGVGSGPYLVLPLLGPSTLRDTAGFAVKQEADLIDPIAHVPTRNSMLALRLVNVRANFLGASRMLDQVALDKYSFTRDAYLQRSQATEQNNEDEDDGFTPNPMEPEADHSESAYPVDTDTTQGTQP